jgi:LysR family transcriptional regulator of gallate degradation
VEGSYLELVEPLRDGEIDLMIGALRDPASVPDLTQAPLFHDRPVIIGRRGHPLARVIADSRDGHILPRLADYPWIVSGPGTPLRAQWEIIVARQKLRTKIKAAPGGRARPMQP